MIDISIVHGVGHVFERKRLTKLQNDEIFNFPHTKATSAVTELDIHTMKGK
jgi:hypothetical protein